MKFLLQLQYHLLKKYLERNPELRDAAVRVINQKMRLLAWEYLYASGDSETIAKAEAGGDPPPPPPPPPPDPEP